MIPPFLKSRLETAVYSQLQPKDGPAIDFTQPPGEPALTSADSISWVIFNNPVSLLIGGISAVLLELAEPKVRTGVWDHTTFRTDPMKRMQRTGLAAMVTVYGAASGARRMIEGVRRMHDRVHGTTPDGTPYQANDPELLCWVHATAAFGFLEAYHTFVHPVPLADRDRYYAEGQPISQLYGAEKAPASEAEFHELFATMESRLEPSAIIHEFLEIMNGLSLFPRPFRFLNRSVIRASVAILPESTRRVLQLDRGWKLSRIEKALIRLLARQADRLELKSSPAYQARQRLLLSSD